MKSIPDHRTGQKREAERQQMMARDRQTTAIALRAALAVVFLMVLIAGVIVFRSLGHG